MKKTLSLLLCVLVVLSLAAVAAGAENGEVLLISGSKQTEYADYKEALKYAYPGDTIRLLKDITLYGSESITISAGVPLTFDGNGHTINSPYGISFSKNTGGADRTGSPRMRGIQHQPLPR